MSGGSDRRLALGLLAAGLIGLVASTTLLIERLRLAGDEEYVPTCSLNPVLSCGSIMESAQASLLGFPNPVIGVAGFPVVLATGAAGGQGQHYRPRLALPLEVLAIARSIRRCNLVRLGS